MTLAAIPRLILCLLLTLAVGKAGSEEARIELPDHNGQMHAPLEVGGKQAVLLVFTGHDNFGTEISMDAIRAIVTDYQERVAIYLVQSERGSRPTAAKRFAKQLQIDVPILLDSKLALARKVQARVIPEAVVLSRDGQVLYQGRIDDSLAGPDPWHTATTADLREALQAILAGRPVPQPQHAAVGQEILGVAPLSLGRKTVQVLGPVLFIASILIPLINGFRLGRLRTSIWTGWLLSFLGTLFMCIEPSEAATGGDDSCAAPSYLIIGWVHPIIFHVLGAFFRAVFESLRRLFSQKVAS